MTAGPMTADEMAALQARAYTHMPPWSALALTEMMSSPLALLVTAPNGFALARVVADEAELLALAVDPDYQRQGIARALLVKLEHDAHARGAETCFLEVAETNGPARAFYATMGYEMAGKRGGYYRQKDGPAVDALLMKKSLTFG